MQEVKPHLLSLGILEALETICYDGWTDELMDGWMDQNTIPHGANEHEQNTICTDKIVIQYLTLERRARSFPKTQNDVFRSS
jgi:hypothetical protein